MNIRDTEEFKSGLFKIVTCPICGEETLNMYWVCENCFWEYDGACNDDDYSFSNDSTVSDYRKDFFDRENNRDTEKNS